jgi:pyruvate/2-oxoacid:ferredoxin oxidoreductase beta subunit
VKGFSKIFSSHIDILSKLIFEFYDFDEDKYIDKEDIRIVLSYVPILEMENNNKNKQKEGRFTSGIGADTSINDRKEAQDELQSLLENIFQDKEKWGFE